jgi:hypothetical protein
MIADPGSFSEDQLAEAGRSDEPLMPLVICEAERERFPPLANRDRRATPGGELVPAEA